MNREEIWPGGPTLLISKDAYPVGTDSIMLADFCRSVNYKNICDLGSGSAVLAIILMSYRPNAGGICIEIQEPAYRLAMENIRINGLQSRIELINDDLRKCREFFKAGTFDLVVSNPPYFPVGHGKSSPDRMAAISREEICCSLDELCGAAAYLTRFGGAFALVYRSARLSELLCALHDHGLEPKRIRFIQDRIDKAPELVLVESRRGGKPGTIVEAPLILYNADGSMSREVSDIFNGLSGKESGNAG